MKGPNVNRGAGYGLEIPCTYHFFGKSLYIEKLQVILDKLRADDTWTTMNNNIARSICTCIQVKSSNKAKILILINHASNSIHDVNE